MSWEILIIMPHNPGDVVMALHAADQLKRLLPHANIDLMTGEECVELMGHAASLRSILAIPRSALQAKWRSGNPQAAIQALENWLKGIEKLHYQLAINFFQGPFGAFIQSFIIADKKIGLELKDGQRFATGSRILEHLFAIPAARGQNPFHVIDLYRLAALQALPFPFPTEKSAFKAELAPFSSPFSLDFPPQSYFVFHPGAAFPGKRWPTSKWAQLATLTLEAGHKIVWTGSHEEKAWMEEIAAKIPRIDSENQINKVGETTWQEAISLYRGAQRVVCGDTAAMHIAAAMGIPVIALFGPTNPVETGPYGPNHLIIHAQPTLSSDFLLNSECPQLTKIDPEGLAHLLLTGQTDGFPPDTLWSTEWDTTHGIQILRDRNDQIHPFQKQAETWLKLFLSDKLVLSHPSVTTLGIALKKARESPTSDSLKNLDQAERIHAEETHHQLVWEAYRVALNGLPVNPLSLHLHLRQDLLARAETEFSIF